MLLTLNEKNNIFMFDFQSGFRNFSYAKILYENKLTIHSNYVG